MGEHQPLLLSHNAFEEVKWALRYFRDTDFFSISTCVICQQQSAPLQLTAQNTEGCIRLTPNSTQVATLESPTKENRGIQGLVPLHNDFLSLPHLLETWFRAEKVRTGYMDFSSLTVSVNRLERQINLASRARSGRVAEGKTRKWKGPSFWNLSPASCYLTPRNALL